MKPLTFLLSASMLVTGLWSDGSLQGVELEGIGRSVGTVKLSEIRSNLAWMPSTPRPRINDLASVAGSENGTKRLNLTVPEEIKKAIFGVP